MSVLLLGWDDGPHGTHRAVLERFTAWAAQRIRYIGQADRFGPCTAIVAAREPRLDLEPLAVVVYHNSDPVCRTLEISMAASTPRWASRGTIRACLAYPFQQLGCGVVVCRVPKRAKRTKRFLAGIGFRACGMVPAGFGNDDCAIYAMRRADAARWLATEAADARAA